MTSERRRWLATAVLAATLVAPCAHAATVEVVINKLVYAPAMISAKVGDTIVWVNKDFLPHTATVKGAWDVMIPVGKSATLVLKKAGTVEYYCRFHPNMKGRIAVAPQ